MLQERKTQNAKRPLRRLSEASKTAVQNLKLFSFTLLLCALTFALYASPAYAQTPPCDPTFAGDCPAGLDQIKEMVSNVISVIVGLGFIAMLVLLIFAGIKYLTSGGEPKALQAAHMTVTWALLGIFFLALAWIILQLISAFTGLDLTTFNVKVLCTDPLNSLQFCKPN